jgi:RNA polymerase sigma factor (sigma-70 family)
MNDLTKKQRFHTIVMPHLSSAFNLARWLSHGHQEAEDIVQEAFLRAFKYFDGFHGEDGRTWLLSIVRNTFYTWYQQNKIQAQSTPYEDELHGFEFEMTSIHDENNPENKLIQKNSQRLLNEALRELPIEFREVMVMRELEDLSYKQIADIMQIPMGTVMSRLGRGRKQLAAILVARTENGGAK